MLGRLVRRCFEYLEMKDGAVWSRIQALLPTSPSILANSSLCIPKTVANDVGFLPSVSE